MAILYKGSGVAPNVANLQETDFSEVTVHPEFVLKGKKFYDETGQLKQGTATLFEGYEGRDIIAVSIREV